MPVTFLKWGNNRQRACWGREWHIDISYFTHMLSAFGPYKYIYIYIFFYETYILYFNFTVFFNQVYKQENLSEIVGHLWNDIVELFESAEDLVR